MGTLWGHRRTEKRKKLPFFFPFRSAGEVICHDAALSLPFCNVGIQLKLVCSGWECEQVRGVTSEKVCLPPLPLRRYANTSPWLTPQKIPFRFGLSCVSALETVVSKCCTWTVFPSNRFTNWYSTGHPSWLTTFLFSLLSTHLLSVHTVSTAPPSDVGGVCGLRQLILDPPLLINTAPSDRFYSWPPSLQSQPPSFPLASLGPAWHSGVRCQVWLI